MAEKIYMIALSPTMADGTIHKWNKKEGDFVKSGDIICEVETDKATMEYESNEEGILLKIIIQEGNKAKIGDTIAIIGKAGENIEDLVKSLSAEQVKNNDGITATNNTISNIVIPMQKMKNRETLHISNKSGSGESDSKNIEERKNNKTINEYNIITDNNRIKISPLARNIASQKGIDIQNIKGTGPEGRIIKEDILSYNPLNSNVSNIHTMRIGSDMPILEDQIIPLSVKQKTAALRLSESMFSAPHFYLTVSVFMDRLMQSREQINQSLQDKISLNAFLIKISAEAIKRNSIINSYFDNNQRIQRGQVNIGLAVALYDGLTAPVIKNAQNKGLLEINNELAVLIQKAKQGKLNPEDYSDATFTISNLGSYGIEEFTAIINPPGSAILAVGEIKKTPVVDEQDHVVVKSVMKMTLSCDHRVIDGARGALFLKSIRDIIENPITLLV